VKSDAGFVLFTSTQPVSSRLYSTGLSVSAVSKELKVGRDVVYGEITRRGISRTVEKTA